jgi:DNA replication protein DnaC
VLVIALVLVVVSRDVLFIGPPGVGKSHLAQAIGLEALKAGFVVLYRSIFDRLLHHAEVVAITGRSYRIQPVAKPSKSSH